MCIRDRDRGRPRVGHARPLPRDRDQPRHRVSGRRQRARPVARRRQGALARHEQPAARRDHADPDHPRRDRHRQRVLTEPRIMTLVTPHTAIARPVPTGVASNEGRVLFLRGGSGIDAVDVHTGRTMLSFAAALPVIAPPLALIALRAQVRGDRWWTGRAEVVNINIATGAARIYGAFELPAPDGELGDVWWAVSYTHLRAHE